MRFGNYLQLRLLPYLEELDNLYEARVIGSKLYAHYFCIKTEGAFTVSLCRLLGQAQVADCKRVC